MKKQLMIVGITLLLIVIGFSGCFEDETETIIISKYSSAEDALSNLRYINSDYAYGFNPIENWYGWIGEGYAEGVDSIFFYCNDSYNVSLMISPWEGDTEDTINESVDFIIQQYRNSYADCELISKTYKIINGMTSIEVIKTYTELDLIKSKEIWMIKGSKGIVLNYGAPIEEYDIYLPLVDQCIESFFIFDENSGVVLPQDGDERIIDTEFVGGEYDASILQIELYSPGSVIYGTDDDGWIPHESLVYTKDGYEYNVAYYSDLRNALNWIKTNTSENCTILSWWDYGGMIEGYAERNILAKAPSLPLINTVARLNIDLLGGWTSNETINDIANILTSANLSSIDMKEIINENNISYIFTTRYDRDIAYIIFNASDKNIDDYYENYLPNELANESLIYQIWNDELNMDELTLVFENYISDETTSRFDVRIYEIDIS